MKIRVFLKEHFETRLEKSGCLVIYDPEKRYRAIVRDLEESGCRVIDASHSTILAREEAMETWRRLADSAGELQSMVVYLPIPKPKTEVEQQRNPYQPFAIDGTEFPYDDGDSYQALCRKAKPDSNSRWTGCLLPESPISIPWYHRQRDQLAKVEESPQS